MKYVGKEVGEKAHRNTICVPKVLAVAYNNSKTNTEDVKQKVQSHIARFKSSVEIAWSLRSPQ